ncbi:MAG: AAA family ATPase [Chloroflexi bacterium]|nr:AAA family ATPase [Chloroflexota bacterium]
MATSRILLISDARDTAVADALKSSGHEITTVPGVDAAIASGATVTSTEVMVVDLAGGVQIAVEACTALRKAVRLTGIPILCISEHDDVEDRILLLETGVDDVIARPFDARELDARAEALAVRLRRSRDLGASDGQDTAIRDRGQRRTIVVFSPKGGAGTTTIAVNIATALAMQVPGTVAVLDLDVQFGQVATHLNITPRLSFRDLTRDPATMSDPTLFVAALDRHGSGLQVLGASATPDVGGEISDASVRTIVTTASAAFQYVVVDAGSVLDARSESAIALATDLVIVLTPEFPAIKAVHAFGELVAGDAEGTAHVSYVLNEIFARELLRLPDIEEALGTKVALTIPYDAFAFLKSVNEGVPVVQGTPRSLAAEQLSRFATRLAGLSSADLSPARRSKRLASLFSRG